MEGKKEGVWGRTKRGFGVLDSGFIQGVEKFQKMEKEHPQWREGFVSVGKKRSKRGMF